MSMKAYSLDLREKIFVSHDRKEGSQRQLAERYSVSQSFVEKLLMRHRQTGEIEAKPHAGGRRSCVNEPARDKLREWLAEQPDLTLLELTERLAIEQSIKTSPPNLCKILKAMGLCRKKRPSMPQNKIRKEFNKHGYSTVKR